MLCYKTIRWVAIHLNSSTVALPQKLKPICNRYYVVKNKRKNPCIGVFYVYIV